MRLVYGAAVAVVLAMLVPPAIGARGQDAARAVAGGGISVAGWMGKADAGPLGASHLARQRLGLLSAAADPTVHH